LLVGTGLERFNDDQFLGNTMAEIRRFLRALRQKTNDQSLTMAMATLVNVNMNMAEGQERLKDPSIFLPHRSEYLELQQESNANRLNIIPSTARIILAHQSLFGAKVNGIFGHIMDDIQRIADK
jgi:hypothetical protein